MFWIFKQVFLSRGVCLTPTLRRGGLIGSVHRCDIAIDPPVVHRLVCPMDKLFFLIFLSVVSVN